MLPASLMTRSERKSNRPGYAFILLLVFPTLCSALSERAVAETTAFRGARIYPVSAPVIDDGTLVVRDAEIIAVGPTGSIDVPSGATVVDAGGKVIIPGLVDTHSHIGIYPRPIVRAHSDGNEGTDPKQSGVRAIDSIYPHDPAIRQALAGGVTTANIMPGSANVMGGQTAYVKLGGSTIEEMLIVEDGVQGGMKMANGENPKRSYGARGKAPATRMKVAALQRELFVAAQEYQRKWESYEKDGRKQPDRDLDLEPIVEILEGRRTVHHHTHRADDIMTVLRLQREFGYDVVLQHATEAYLVADEIAAAGVPVSIILIESPGGKHEAANYTHENGAILREAGVEVAIHTDDHINPSQLFLRSGALAVRGGMSEEDALLALTLAPARMMDLERRIGSLEAGKDADFAILSGEPFSVYTQVLETYVDGVRRFDREDPEHVRYATGGFGVGDRYPGEEDSR